MSLAKRALRNFIFLSIGSIIGQVFFLLGTIQLGRKLGPAAFGMWTYAQTLLIYMTRLDDFGIEVTAIRTVSKDHSSINQQVNDVLLLRMIFTIITLAVVFCILFLEQPLSTSSILILIFSIGAIPSALYLEWLYESVQKAGRVALTRIMKGFLFFIFVIMTVHFQKDINMGAWSYVLSLSVPAVVLLFIVQIDYRIKLVPLHYKRYLFLLRESWPIAVTTMLTHVELFFAILYLGFVSNSTELGLFSAAHRLVIFVWAYGLVAANRALLPILSSVHEGCAEEYDWHILKILRLSFLIALPIGLVGCLISHDLIRVVYGDAFGKAGEVLQIIVWMIVIGLSRTGLEMGLIASNQQLKYLGAMFVLAGLFIVLIPVGYSVLGLRGMAYGMVIAEGLYTLYLLQITNMFRSLLKAPFLWKGILSLCIALIIELVLPVHIIAKSIAALVIYGMLLISFRELRKSDFSLVRQVLGFSQE